MAVIDNPQRLSPSLVLCTCTKKSVFLIKSPQGPDIQHREVYEPCLIKSMAKKIFKYKYAVCICHR